MGIIGRTVVLASAKIAKFYIEKAFSTDEKNNVQE
jgi:hypothetical protein